MQGGKRLGAGRKPHTRRERWLKGGTVRPWKQVTPDRAPGATVEAIDAPAGLTAAEAAYWTEWAPLATSRGLLTRDNAPGFVLLCKWATVADAFWSCIKARGFEFERVSKDSDGLEHREYKANTLIVQWRGAMARVEQLQARYGLTGDGKVTPGSGSDEADDEGAKLAALLSIR